MLTTFPGMTVETVHLTRGSSRSLFEGIFAAGGITLSQVSIMTGLEPYLIQNWVKRGFVSPPKKRLYTKDQFARIVIINMLRETLQLEKICSLIRVIGGRPDDRSDDLISDDELYHLYFDMLTEADININDEVSVNSAAMRAAASFEEKMPNTRRKLENILKIMLYSHSASTFSRLSENIISSLDQHR